MYFSHARTKDINMYGIGMRDVSLPDPEKSKRISEIFANFGTIFRSKIKYFKILCNYFTAPKKKVIPVTEDMFSVLTDIPLVSFMLRLLDTLSKTKDHLI